MDERRGRPKIDLEAVGDAWGGRGERKFIRRCRNADGSSNAVWTFDLDINPNGPIETVEIPTETEKKEEKQELKKLDLDAIINETLPLTKRKWINPKNGKEVGYTRAKNLGLI
jgi:hypothetical protein